MDNRRILYFYMISTIAPVIYLYATQLPAIVLSLNRAENRALRLGATTLRSNEHKRDASKTEAVDMMDQK